MDYLTINEHRTTCTAMNDQLSPYDEGYADGVEGDKPDTFLQKHLEYRQGYVRGLVASMRAIAQGQRNYTDPLTGFDWF